MTDKNVKTEVTEPAERPTPFDGHDYLLIGAGAVLGVLACSYFGREFTDKLAKTLSFLYLVHTVSDVVHTSVKKLSAKEEAA